MNQYWSLDGLLLVSDSYQYWSEAWPVLLRLVTSTGRNSLLCGHEASPCTGVFSSRAHN